MLLRLRILSGVDRFRELLLRLVREFLSLFLRRSLRMQPQIVLLLRICRKDVLRLRRDGLLLFICRAVIFHAGDLHRRGILMQRIRRKYQRLLLLRQHLAGVEGLLGLGLFLNIDDPLLRFFRSGVRARFRRFFLRCCRSRFRLFCFLFRLAEDHEALVLLRLRILSGVDRFRELLLRLVREFLSLFLRRSLRMQPQIVLLLRICRKDVLRLRRDGLLLFICRAVILHAGDLHRRGVLMQRIRRKHQRLLLLRQHLAGAEGLLRLGLFLNIDDPLLRFFRSFFLRRLLRLCRKGFALCPGRFRCFLPGSADLLLLLAGQEFFRIRDMDREDVVRGLRHGLFFLREPVFRFLFGSLLCQRLRFGGLFLGFVHESGLFLFRSGLFRRRFLRFFLIEVEALVLFLFDQLLQASAKETVALILFLSVLREHFRIGLFLRKLHRSGSFCLLLFRYGRFLFCCLFRFRLGCALQRLEPPLFHFRVGGSCLPVLQLEGGIELLQGVIACRLEGLVPELVFERRDLQQELGHSHGLQDLRRQLLRRHDHFVFRAVRGHCLGAAVDLQSGSHAARRIRIEDCQRDLVVDEDPPELVPALRQDIEHLIKIAVGDRRAPDVAVRR